MFLLTHTPRTRTEYLVQQSRYRDRIDFLRSNQHLGTEPITGDIKSNCWGTTIHLVGGEEFVADAWLEYLERNVFDVNDQVCLPLDCSSPGYVGRWPMIRFLQKRTRPARKEHCKGGIVTFYIPTHFYALVWKKNEEMLRQIYGERILIHSGIYLGSLYGDLMFYQDGNGGRFEITSVKSCAKKFEQDFPHCIDVDYHMTL